MTAGNTEDHNKTRQSFLYAMKPALWVLLYGFACWGVLTLVNPALNPVSLNYLPAYLILLGLFAVHALSVWRSSREATAFKAMRERHEHLELAQQFGCELITLTDRQGRIRYISPSLERLSGYALADVVGKNVNIFKSGHNSPEVYHNLWATLLAGQTWHGMLVNTSASGELYYEEKRIAPIKDAYGSTTLYASCGRDATEEHKAKENLQLSEERFAYAMRAGHDAIWDWNLETNAVYFSPSWKAMLGYDEDELPNHLDSWLKSVHAEDGERVLEQAHAYADQTIADFETEFRMRHKDGRWRTFTARVISAPGRGSQLHGTRLIGTCIDVTETRRAEGEIRLLGRALSAVRNGVVIADATLPDMPIIYVNKGFSEITGYSRFEVLDRNCRFLQGVGTDQAELQKMRQALAEQRATVVTLFNYRKAGEGYWNRLSLAPIFDDGGVLTHYVGVMEDITAERDVELKLRQVNTALANLNQVKSQFMAKMSHELRTPMNGVLGMSQLLLETTLDDEQRDYVQTIESSGNDMLVLIEDLLTYANLDDDNSEAQQTLFPPDEVAKWVVHNKRRKAVAKGLQLNMHVDDGFSETCRFDPKKLHQALNYLVDNAIKFTQAGRVDIDVGHASPGKVRIDVRDSGIGIAPEKLEQIFEAFHQGDNAHSRKFGGLGLGLTLCRALINNMGGTVEVESTLGAGSLFRVVLPSASDDLEGEHDPAGQSIVEPDERNASPTGDNSGTNS